MSDIENVIEKYNKAMQITDPYTFEVRNKELLVAIAEFLIAKNTNLYDSEISCDTMNEKE